MNKKFIAIVAATLMTLPLAACSSTQTNNGTQNDPSNQSSTEKPQAPSELVFDSTRSVTASLGEPVIVTVPEDLVELVDGYQVSPFTQVVVTTVELDSMELCAIKYEFTPRKGADLSWMSQPTGEINEYTPNLSPDEWLASALFSATGYAYNLFSENVDPPLPMSELTQDVDENSRYVDPDTFTLASVDYCQKDVANTNAYKVSPLGNNSHADQQKRLYSGPRYEFGSDSAGNLYFPLPRKDGNPGNESYYLNSSGDWKKD